MSVTLKDVPLFHGLSSDQLEMIKKCLHEKSFKKGDALFSEGSGCERVFIVKSGRVKVFRTAANGREQILEILDPGDTCACNPGNVVWFCSSSGQAMDETTVWYLSRTDYIKMVEENSQVSHTLNEVFAARIQCFASLIEEVSLKDVRKRLIKFLLDMLADKHKDKAVNDILFISYTREEIAQRLGTSRETIARYLTQLKDAHLIEMKPYQIIIKDKAGLEALLK